MYLFIYYYVTDHLMKPQNSDFNAYIYMLFYQIYIDYYSARKHNWFSYI